MSIQSLAALMLMSASMAPLPPPIVIELGLSAPIERLDEVDAFARQLAERLVWTVDGGNARELTASGSVALRFTALRVERGRVTASYRSDLRAGRMGLVGIAETVGRDQFAAFPDVCLTATDPPARVRAISGTAHLGAEELERVVAGAARTGRLDGALGLDGPVELEWGRHVLLILSAATRDEQAVVRPLFLLLERL